MSQNQPTRVILILISALAFGCMSACLDSSAMHSGSTFLSMLFDLASLTLPFICLGLYSTLPLQAAHIACT